MFARAKKAIGWFAAVWYLLLAIGVPLPVGYVSAAAASGEVYPCMHHRCGCNSAQQCWRDCCCMSMAEKLAWAKTRNITPPSYVVAAAEREVVAKNPAASCCCCASHCAKPVNSDDTAPVGVPASADPIPAKAGTSTTGIVFLAALQCRGAGDNWLGLATSLPPPVAVAWTIELVPIAPCPGTTQTFLSITPLLDPPPPRMPVA